MWRHNFVAPGRNARVWLAEFCRALSPINIYQSTVKT